MIEHKIEHFGLKIVEKAKTTFYLTAFSEFLFITIF